MNFETYSVWASAKNISASRARRLYNDAVLAASRYARTDSRHWATLREKLSVSETTAGIFNIKAESQIAKLGALASHLRRQSGETSFVDEGRNLVLRYSRNSSTGISYPFSDFCNFQIVYDTVTGTYQCSGTVFGYTAPAPTTNEPGLFLMQSIDLSQAFTVVARDFFRHAKIICERYGAHNIDQFTFKLQCEIRSLGVMERLDASKAPNVAQFTAAEVPFTAWFSKSNLGLGVIKFNPALNISGYSLNVRTFHLLLEALDQHILSHQEFVKSCIAVDSDLAPV